MDELLTAHYALARALLWATNNPVDDLAGPGVQQATDEFLEALMKQSVFPTGKVQLPLIVDQTLKDRLDAESDRLKVSRAEMIREWLTADVSSAEKARGIEWAPAPTPPPPIVTSTPEAEKFAVSTMGEQTPPMVDGNSMPTQAGPGPVPPAPKLTNNPGPQKQEDTDNETT